LADVAGLTPTDGHIIIGDGSNFVTEDGATARASLGLTIGTHVQAYDAQLADIAGLSPTDSNIIIGDGSNFVLESGATARTSLGVGTGDSPQFTGIELGHASDTTITRPSAGDISVEGNIVYRAGGTDVPVTDGGTGASNASDARDNLGLTIGTDVQAYDAQLADVAGLTPTDGHIIIGDGSNFVTEDGATARASLGLTIGTHVQAYDAQLADIAGLSPTDSNIIIGDGSNFVLESGATARTSLGVGTGDSPQFTGIELGHASDTTITRPSAGDISVEGNIVYRAGGTDVPLTDGGTGASNASDARDNLGLTIGTDVQAYDAQLDVISGLATTDGGVIVGDGTNFVLETGDTLRTSLGLAIGSNVQAYHANLAAISTLTAGDGNFIVGNGTSYATENGATARASLGLTIGTDVQAYDAQLADVAGLAVTDGGFIVGDGSNFVLETADTARTSLGLGSGNTPQFTGIEVGHASDTTISRPSAGDISVEGKIVYRADGTDVPVTDGGTGASTAGAARTNLGLAIGSDVQAYSAKLADISGLDVTDGGFIVGDGSNFVLETGGFARTSLGLAIGSDVQAHNARLDDISGLAVTDGNIIVGDGSNFVAENGATARASLGLAIGSDVQAYDAQLADVAGLTPTDGHIIIGDGSNFVTENGATARASLGLTIGTHVQAYDAQLADVAGLTPTDGHIIIGDGSNFVTENGATARTSLGLGSGDTVTFNAIFNNAGNFAVSSGGDVTCEDLTVNASISSSDTEQTVSFVDPLIRLNSNNQSERDCGTYSSLGSNDNLGLIYDASDSRFKLYESLNDPNALNRFDFAAGSAAAANVELGTIILKKSAPTSSTGSAGDITGMIAADSNYLYYCTADHDGTTNIWKRVALSSDTW
jgi:hypothetical protein